MWGLHMKILRLMLLSCLILLNISYVFAGTIDPNTPDKLYIEYGSKFTNIAKLCCINSDNQKACGSAVIISPHWIVTAAHIVDGSTSCKISIENKQYNLSKIICHENYKDSVFGQNDIALGYTEEPIELDFFPDLYHLDDEVGKVCSISGFGYAGTFLSGASIDDFKKRAGSNIVDKIEKGTIICSASINHVDRKTELEFLIASGDSGGGLFIDGKLAGINSAIISRDGSPNSDYGDESCHTRISALRNWILNHISNTKK